MQKLLIYLLLLLIPVVNNAGNEEVDVKLQLMPDTYTAMNLSESGLDRAVFTLALMGLKKLDTKGQLNNPHIITIADYSQSSTQKRLYVIDLKHRRLLFHTYVAHGRNTGEEYARLFSNEEGSLKSSLGFYVTTQPMEGATAGFALKLQGVENGINDNAEKRAIIMHGGDYVSENYIKKHGFLGRSLGCPTLPPEFTKPIIETIKGGSCLFIYNLDNNYFAQSPLLN